MIFFGTETESPVFEKGFKKEEFVEICPLSIFLNFAIKSDANIPKTARCGQEPKMQIEK